MRGCINCKYKKSELVWLDNNSKSIMIHDCKLGFKDKTNDWWNNNGHKTEESELESMDCFEETDSMKALKKIINGIDKMIEITNNFNDKMIEHNNEFDKIISNLKNNKNI